MKHITERYGSPCDLIESTYEEFCIMREFLKEYGVEVRKCSSLGNVYVWQIRNVYKDNAGFKHLTGAEITERSERAIENGYWCR